MHADGPTTSGIGRANIDLEKEYSPSRCSNRAVDSNPDVLVNKFIEIHKKETERVGKVYKSRRDVRYGDSERESMDIYFKDEEHNTPIFVYVHGGYWIALDKGNSGICVAPLVEKGYRVVVMDYNLCPSVTLEELVQQMRKFFQFLLEYAAETNAGRISLCGHSAGAHLIATLLQQECLDLPYTQLIAEIFLISGIYDLRELRKTEAGNPGNALSLDEESAKKLSPIFYNLPECLENIQIHIMAAEQDSRTFRRQSEEFFKKLELDGIPTCFPIFPGYDHFTIIEELRNEKSLITTYLLYALDSK